MLSLVCVKTREKDKRTITAYPLRALTDVIMKIVW